MGLQEEKPGKPEKMVTEAFIYSLIWYPAASCNRHLMFVESGARDLRINTSKVDA